MHAVTSGKPYLCEVAWEVCQQVGGIYTVIRSKVPSVVDKWQDRYLLLGPYSPQNSPAEFEELPADGIWAEIVEKLRRENLEVHYGHWLISGRPRVLLFNPASVRDRLGDIKYRIWQNHAISLPAGDGLIDDVVAFGYMVEQFFRIFIDSLDPEQQVIAHFHEWMAGVAIAALRRLPKPPATVFTTHATLLGRYLATNDPWFYDHLTLLKWADEARNFNIEAQVMLERACTHGAHIFSTVSEVTALECEHLLGRKPDCLLPNGLNIERFVALHEFQNLHRVYKERIQQFVMSHFFPSYTFDLDKTLFLFSSGRYEYRNKGFDMTIEALARLNWKLKQINSDRTVIFFLVTRRPYHHVIPHVMQSRAAMEDMRSTCEAIKNQIGEQLFLAAARGQVPSIDSFLDEFWRLRLRRMMLAWQRQSLPPIVTHELVDDANDEVLKQLRACQLLNLKDDPVKVVYHPEFVSATGPLFGMDYDHFVRGCHLGIFPSSYEPWGYTPLECAARGVPAVTSDLAGFGAYVQKNLPEHDAQGMYVIKRRDSSFGDAAQALTDQLLAFSQQSRRERISQRNRVEALAAHFDWGNLGTNYEAAYEKVLDRV